LEGLGKGKHFQITMQLLGKLPAGVFDPPLNPLPRRGNRLLVFEMVFHETNKTSFRQLTYGFNYNTLKHWQTTPLRRRGAFKRIKT